MVHIWPAPLLHNRYRTQAANVEGRHRRRIAPTPSDGDTQANNGISFFIAPPQEMLGEIVHLLALCLVISARTLLCSRGGRLRC
jgi:hypothetical protein